MFTDGKECFPCPSGCLDCELNYEYIWMMVVGMWQPAIPDLQDYLSQNSGDPASIADFDPDTQSFSEIRAWILVTVLATVG